MNILVLDTIHGGDEISRRLISLGHNTDTVDVYRHKSGISEGSALLKNYDLTASPVHLDPEYPLLKKECRIISHHQAAAMIIGDKKPELMIEITGAKGKTTTAHALAHVLRTHNNRLLLHTSKGTVEFPGGKTLWKKSITPASVIDAALYAHENGLWLIAEESLGVTGAGDIAILTSKEDYPIASGKKSAIKAKLGSMKNSGTVITAPGEDPGGNTGAYHSEDITEVKNGVCRYSYKGINGSFRNPLLEISGYKKALQTAAATACILGIDPACLKDFLALEGRMSSGKRGSNIIIDNSNSGVNKQTTLDAVRYARKVSPKENLTLVIGLEANNICEGFPAEDILDAIRQSGADKVVLAGEAARLKEEAEGLTGYVTLSSGLSDGRETAEKITDDGLIVLSVKTWR
ncbi:coenzyme F430 synthase [Methanoplanus limicola]|uniref:Mur ligase middle domain protein n=1 Tax=Methanoplanus limicola DSM 2279 TaxID=937775 RepID=H1Z1R9_9EURY|nr:coenzyme F430 synthase [Methanoplanus limicola]EHQ34595.1 Mur ligase middle domain protein [Methanoplanus limicola DSM 2279]